MYVSFTVQTVSQNSQKGMLSCILQNRPHVVGRPGIFGVLPSTYFILEHTKSFSGSIVVWVMGRRAHTCRSGGPRHRIEKHCSGV